VPDSTINSTFAESFDSARLSSTRANCDRLDRLRRYQLSTSKRWPIVSGVATVGHGWVVRFAQIQRVFWRSRGGGSILRMSLKVHRISSMNTPLKCICPLQIVYAYLASEGFAPRPHQGSTHGPRWGLLFTNLLCPPYLQTLAMPLPIVTIIERLKSVFTVLM